MVSRDALAARCNRKKKRPTQQRIHYHCQCMLKFLVAWPLRSNAAVDSICTAGRRCARASIYPNGCQNEASAPNANGGWQLWSRGPLRRARPPRWACSARWASSGSGARRPLWSHPAEPHPKRVSVGDLCLFFDVSLACVRQIGNKISADRIVNANNGIVSEIQECTFGSQTGTKLYRMELALLNIYWWTPLATKPLLQV